MMLGVHLLANDHALREIFKRLVVLPPVEVDRSDTCEAIADPIRVSDFLGQRETSAEVAERVLELPPLVMYRANGDERQHERRFSPRFLRELEATVVVLCSPIKCASILVNHTDVVQSAGNPRLVAVFLPNRDAAFETINGWSKLISEAVRKSEIVKRERFLRRSFTSNKFQCLFANSVTLVQVPQGRESSPKLC